MVEDEKSCIRCRYAQLRLGSDSHIITWECEITGAVVHQVVGKTGRGSVDRRTSVRESVCGYFELGEYFEFWLKERPSVMAKAAEK